MQISSRFESLPGSATGDCYVAAPHHDVREDGVSGADGNDYGETS